MRKPELNAEVVQWLNKKTTSSNNKIVLVEGFCFMLLKIKIQRSVRLVDGDCFHQRFWKSLDRTLNYDLHRKKKGVSVSLYEFYYDVSVSEGFVTLENGRAFITDKGIDFLQQPLEEQLSFLLSKMW